MHARLVPQGVPEAARPDSLRTVKRHICFVAPHIWPVLSGDASIRMVGGAEVQQSILIRLLARAGYRVSVITQDFGQPQQASLDGVTVYKTFRADEGIPVLRFLHPRLTSIWRALKQVDADIYYQRCASMLTGVLAEFCRRYGKRSVYAAASDADFVPGHRQIRYARDRMLFEHGLRNVDRIVVQNPGQLEACRRNYGRSATLIPSAYELPAAAGKRSGELVVWAARIMPDKRPELFLELARRLPHRRFVLIGGSGGDDAFYERVLETARTLPNVQCTGFLPLAQAEGWFDRARIVVNTSSYEGMPNTFMQACARGVPTVATVDVGAPVQILFHDAEDGAAQIERLFTDETHWTRASRACGAYFAERHSAAAVLAQYDRLLEGLE